MKILEIFRPEGNTGRRLVLGIAAVLLLTGCKGSAPSNPSRQAADTKLDEWSWLPGSSKHEADVAQISKDAELELFIPKDDPLASKSVGWGKVGTAFNFIPTEKKSYVVSGGALVSKIGAIEKKAKWGDWDFVQDAAHPQHVSWGHSLTSGEVLLPRAIFVSIPTDAVVQNSFEIEAFGDTYVLIRLDPAKGHRLCFLQVGRLQLPTAGYVGTKAEVDGKILERKTDGWYLSSKKMSQPSSSTNLDGIYAKGDDKPDSGIGGGPSIMILDNKITTENPIYSSKNLEFPLDSEKQDSGKRKQEYIQSEGWLAYSPPISASDKKAALIDTPKGRMIAGNGLLAYKIDNERRWGFFPWKE
jgi:hypothetical protein